MKILFGVNVFVVISFTWALYILSTDATIKQADWDSDKAKVKFSRDLDSQIAEVQNAKLSKLNAQFEVIFICDS